MIALTSRSVPKKGKKGAKNSHLDEFRLNLDPRETLHHRSRLILWHIKTEGVAIREEGRGEENEGEHQFS